MVEKLWGKNLKTIFSAVAILIIVLILIIIGEGACKREEENSRIKIGFSMDSLVIDRWQRDRDIFVAKAQEMGAEVIVQNANGSNEEQINQVKYLANENVDVLVVIPNDGEGITPAVRYAQKRGIKVIAYDRIVRNADVDIYISFNNYRVGELMAEHLVKRVPRGNYMIINGSSKDFNSYMFNEGYKSILEPYVEVGKINIVSEIWAEDWRGEDAFQGVEDVLKQNISLDGILAANDRLAEASIRALSERRLAGQVIVTGHDAELSGCQRVAEGTQLMTVYKPIEKLAEKAAQTAIMLANGEEVEANSSIDDGSYIVPYYMIEPIAVTADNLIDTVIKDGFHRMEDVYRNVPAP